VMSLPDTAMGATFRLVTRWTRRDRGAEEGCVLEWCTRADAKMRLASEIVEIFHGSEAAAEAEQSFVRVFQQGDLPAEMAGICPAARAKRAGRAGG